MTDFTLYVASQDNLGGYYYYARRDILSDYRSDRYKNPPVRTDYLTVEWARSQGEVTATMYVEAMRSLAWAATNILGRGHLPGDRNRVRFSLDLITDLVEWNSRIEIIVRRVEDERKLFVTNGMVDVQEARRKVRLQWKE